MVKALMFLVVLVAACGPSTGVSPSRTPSMAPSRPSASRPAPQPTGPKIEKRITTEVVHEPFGRSTRDDDSVEQGRQYVETPGVEGLRKRIYEVTFTNGVLTGQASCR